MSTLQEINERLEKIIPEIATTTIALRKLEIVYNLRFWDLILHSGMGNQAAREAEANLTCETEGLLEPLQLMKADLRALLNEKECLIAISANLRVLEHQVA